MWRTQTCIPVSLAKKITSNFCGFIDPNTQLIFACLLGSVDVYKLFEMRNKNRAKNECSKVKRYLIMQRTSESKVWFNLFLISPLNVSIQIYEITFCKKPVLVKKLNVLKVSVLAAQILFMFPSKLHILQTSTPPCLPSASHLSRWGFFPLRLAWAFSRNAFVTTGAIFRGWFISISRARRWCKVQWSTRASAYSK